MSGAILSPEDRAHLALMIRHQTPSPVHRWMNALLLLNDDWRAERVAEALFFDPDTVREHHRLHQASGLAGINQLKYKGIEPVLNEEQLPALGAELDAHLYMTAKAVCAYVEQTFNLTYTPQAMAKLLKRQGFVYKLPKSIPAKANEEVQRRFVEETSRH